MHPDAFIIYPRLLKLKGNKKIDSLRKDTHILSCLLSSASLRANHQNAFHIFTIPNATHHRNPPATNHSNLPTTPIPFYKPPTTMLRFLSLSLLSTVSARPTPLDRVGRGRNQRPDNNDHRVVNGEVSVPLIAFACIFHFERQHVVSTGGK